MHAHEIHTHKTQLQSYFDGIGFERWSAIYGDANLSRVRQSIRTGHTRMLEQAAAWLTERCATGRLLDAGCGTGLFSVQMASQGFAVTAIDIAPRMIAATRHAAQQANVSEQIDCHVGDIERIAAGLDCFDAVVCFDVLVHYPQASFIPLCTQLARQCKGPFLLTYAPYNRSLALLHRIGGFFPKGQRRTEIQMIRASVVAGALALAGMKIRRSINISQGFYHVTLLEAGRL